MSGHDLAMAARDLVGIPFRLNGRDRTLGLDCIGVLAAALEAIGRPVVLPVGYTLRVRSLADWLPDPAALGFEPARNCARPGDVILIDCGAAQFHLAIAAPGGGFVHAHAGLRCVVHSPSLPDGRVAGQWRLMSDI